MPLLAGGWDVGADGCKGLASLLGAKAAGNLLLDPDQAAYVKVSHLGRPYLLLDGFRTTYLLMTVGALLDLGLMFSHLCAHGEQIEDLVAPMADRLHCLQVRLSVRADRYPVYHRVIQLFHHFRGIPLQPGWPPWGRSPFRGRLMVLGFFNPSLPSGLLLLWLSLAS